MPAGIGWEQFWPLLLLVAIDVFYQIPYYSALRRIDTSVVVALFSLAKITVPVLAYFIVNEKLTFTQYAGFILIVFTSIFLNMENSRCIKLNTAFWLMVAVSLFLALEAVIYKYILFRLDWGSTLFYVTVFSTLLVLGFLLFRSPRTTIAGDFSQYKKSLKYFLINEALYQAGLLPEIFALSLIPVMVSEGISATQPLFSLLFGALLYHFYGDRFKENFDRRQLSKKMLCYFIIILGVVMTIG